MKKSEMLEIYNRLDGYRQYEAVVRALSLLEELIKKYPDDPREPGVYAIRSSGEKRVAEVKANGAIYWWDYDGTKITPATLINIIWGKKLEFPSV